MEIRYARSGDVEIAYSMLGDGPSTLVLVAGAFTNLEVLWEHPDYRRFCERLGVVLAAVLFDKRGMGLSDRVAGRHARGADGRRARGARRGRRRSRPH